MTKSPTFSFFETFFQALIAIGRLQDKSEDFAKMEAQEMFTMILKVTASYMVSTRPEEERNMIIRKVNDHQGELDWLVGYLESIGTEPLLISSLYQATEDIMSSYFEEVVPSITDETKDRIEKLILESFKSYVR